jgi:hypothetical protein
MNKMQYIIKGNTGKKQMRLKAVTDINSFPNLRHPYKSPSICDKKSPS